MKRSTPLQSQTDPKQDEDSKRRWIGFTVVANLALTASGVGMESYPDSPGGLIICFYYD